MRVLLVGGGRMGQRHLSGIVGVAGEIAVVDPDARSRQACRRLITDGSFHAFGTLDDIPSRSRFDLAIIATTAAGRLETLRRMLDFELRWVLAEKPLEQSREKTRALLRLANAASVPLWVNHYRRCLPAYALLVGESRPLNISVCTGAMGLGCNGIHWIDFALYLSGQQSGSLMFGEIEEELIGSGRGNQYCDYGGRGLFVFPDGSRLYLSSPSSSSAPAALSIVTPDQHWIVDQEADLALIHKRRKGADHPVYLYGKDYEFEERRGVEQYDHSARSREFVTDLEAGRTPRLPAAHVVAPAYELLFDLLETSGQTNFRFA
jgi:siroheme synthase (precorrin-2 oxidase/ferrochelatase)